MQENAPVPIDACRCVVIPNYNSGPRLERTVSDVMSVWQPVIVVDDGSTDGSWELPEADGLEVLRCTRNRGKGAALQTAFERAAARNFTHVATFDADGQHCAADLPHFMEISRANPRALVAGQPVFGENAPRIRVLGHSVANFWTRLETSGRAPSDSLCGFRVYPLEATTLALSGTRYGQGFDFETVAGVRLAQRKVPCISVKTPIRYERNGGSHFRYVRDNFLLMRTHAVLLASALPFYRGICRRETTPGKPARQAFASE